MDQTGQESLEYGYLTGNILCYNYKYDTAREEYADYSYDNNGNLLSKTGVPVNITNTYDGFNRLVSAAVEGGSSASYEYNGDGLRTAKTAKGTRTEFIWDGDRLVCEISGESVTVYKYGTVTHVALITRVDSTGIYYTGRTNDRLDQSIADMYFGKQRQIDGTYKTVSDSERFKGKMYIIRLKY